MLPSPYCLYALLRRRTTSHLVVCATSLARGLALMLAVRLLRGMRMLPEAPQPMPALVAADDPHVAALMVPRTARGAATTAAP